MPQVIKYFSMVNKQEKLSAIGVATFGPIDLDPSSPYYGYITTPPKIAWRQFDFLGALRLFNLPLGWDTDVNGSALGEYYFGAAKSLDTFLYVTVGTGIGVGGMVSGKMIHGLIHPEMGHIFIPHDNKKDKFAGVCPFHGDCLEGLASGPALKKRWGVKSAMDLPQDHVAWELETDYLATAFANYTLMFSPKKIIVGGGVMKHQGLLPRIRIKTKNLLNGYIKHEKILNKIDEYIVNPGLGGLSGISGAIALAETAYLTAESMSKK
jgi:fructokinase